MAVVRMQSKQFEHQKEQCLSGVDLSRKGSVDAPILELVNFINEQPDCFTTSSCSGRIIVVDNTDAHGDVQKQGCQWLYVTHEQACCKDVISALKTAEEAAVFKFEPMVMHIQAQSLELAQRLHTTAVASGFRNSGISIGGKGKIIVAVRSTHSLEVPLTSGGQLLVSDEYLDHLVCCGNQKMRENVHRISRFFDNLKLITESPQKREKQKKDRRRPQNCKEPEASASPAGTVEKHHAESGEQTNMKISSGCSSSEHIDTVEYFDCLLFTEETLSK